MTSEKNEMTQNFADERIGPLTGDRLCSSCGYNLAGQNVIREPHYRMLIVRCPECGAVASLQEYPLLGRWANRWAVVCAGLWLFVIIVVLFVTSIGFGTVAHELSQQIGYPLAQHMADLQHQWAREQGLIDDAATWRYQPNMWVRVDAKWWALQDAADLRKSVETPIFTPRIRSMLVMMWPFAALTGAVWSLLVPQLRRRWLPIFGMIVAAFVGLIPMFIAIVEPMMGMGSMMELARSVLGVRVWLPALSMLIPFMIGLLLGRSVARLMVRTLLPPRLCHALAPLWRIDGLEPPRVRLR